MPKRGRKTIEERGQLSVTLPADFIKWLVETAQSSGVARGVLLRECALAGRKTIAERVRKKAEPKAESKRRRGRKPSGNEAEK